MTETGDGELIDAGEVKHIVRTTSTSQLEVGRVGVAQLRT